MKRISKTTRIWLLSFLAIVGVLFVLDARVNATASFPTQSGLTFDVSKPVSPVLSLAVRELVPSQPEAILAREVNPFQWLGAGVGEAGRSIGVDSLSPHSVNSGTTPLPLVTFEGVSSLSGVTPPDTNGDVGPNHYVQMTNFSFQIWGKGDPTHGIPPSALIPPTLTGDLFAPLGGQCADNFGDPIVLYDDLADRWLLSQFGLSGPLAMCLAISTTPDPTGTYYLYELDMPDFPDYPKIGVWPDAYYMGTNTGYPNEYYAHAFDRASLLAGAPATRQSFGGLANLPMPADVDGRVAPPPGTPGIFYTYFHPDGEGHPAGQERLALYEFAVDWDTPANSTFTLADELPLSPFNYTICGFFAGGCIPQPGTSQPLDDIAWWPMFRFQYRNFGGYAAMVGNFTVDPDDTDRAAIRWFEVRKDGGGYSLFQEGTYAPDTDSRWMGSIAMDMSGNIALGYSVSSETTIPSIRYATRLNGDLPGTLAPEAELWAGGGVQTGIQRWGDYSNLAVDPVDGCTFWYTTEYHDTDDVGFAWNTRIGVFRIPTCGGPHGELTGQVTDSATSQGLPDAAIHATASLTKTGYTLTDPNGFYTMTLLEGSYALTATLYGYFPDTITGVDIFSGTTTTQNFQLDPAPIYTVSGQVTDAETGWPLYAEMKITGYPGEPVWTDPLTGQYTVDLAAGLPYTFKVTSWTGGYAVETRVVGPLAINQTEDFALSADHAACMAPGYQSDFFFFEDFETHDGGFSGDGNNTSWAWGHPTSGPGGAHSGQNAWATNLTGNYNDGENSSLTSPLIDLSAFSGQTVIISWWQWLETEQCCDFGSVEVSHDGGGSWMSVYGPVNGSVDNTWTKYTIPLDASYAVSNFQMRFVLSADGSITYPGYYIDDVGVGIAVPPPVLYAEDFETNDGGYAVSGVTSWEWGIPTRGPSAAHSGENVWATNLDENYGNNEDGYVTSPVINLSGGADETMLLSWWQWLQTEKNYDFANVEVTSDGLTWTQVYTSSGIISNSPAAPLGGGSAGWLQQFVELDSSYATSTFQVRFGLQSDASVNYPGFYIDDVQVEIFVPGPPNVSCDPQPGGLVSGYVLDENTGASLNGATVTTQAGSAFSQATPEDEAFNDGFYLVFAPAGTTPITATLSDYGPDVQSPVIPLGGAVWQTFNLPAGLLSAAPITLEVTLDLGATFTQPFTLTNAGGLEAVYQLQERDQGFTPVLAHVPGTGQWLSRAEEGLLVRVNNGEKDGMALAYPAAYRWEPANYGGGGPNILIYADDPVHAAPDTLVDQALQALALPYTAHYEADFSGFESDLTNNSWDLVIFADDNWAAPASLFAALNTYATNGGQLIFHSWVVGDYSSEPLWTTLGFTWVQDNYDSPAPVYWWDPAHPAFTDPLEVPEFTTLDGEIYGVYGQYVEPLPDALAIAGYTTPGPDSNQAALILNNDGHTVFRGFLDGQNSADLDSDGLLDGLELWINLIQDIQFGFAVDVPWLRTDVVSGTLSAGSEQLIQVAFDAGVPEITQPGTYQADLILSDNTPYLAPRITAILNVNPVSGWGKLTGSVTGLGYCDAADGPLVAEVDITGVTTTQSDTSGLYIYWMPAGEYQVTLSASGYLSQTFSVTLTDGGTTTQDAVLRIDAPCSSTSEDALDLTVASGDSVTAVAFLHNEGAGVLDFTFFETPLAFGQVVAPALPVALIGAGGGGATGPASALSLVQGGGPGSEGVEAPLAGWFSATDHPEGVIRYASAQCYEQPDSYYVAGGVDGSFGLSSSLWRFDVSTNAWTQLADVPAGHEAPAAACYQGKIYLMGGNGTDEMYVYETTQDSWRVGASLPRGVEGAAAAAWNGLIYLVGGDDDFSPESGVSNEVNIYEIATDTWLANGTAMPVGAGNAGTFQMGSYLYIVGGWGEMAPTANLTTTLRYDLDNDAWETGPLFDSARADFALAATEGRLYALGGDEDGGGFFDGTAKVEQLDLSAWPNGPWTTFEPLPVPLMANNAGFCTQNLFDPTMPEVWSVGGLDANFGQVTGRTLFQERPGESCYSIYSDVAWLSFNLESGSVPTDASLEFTVTVDAAALLPGSYTATLVIATNDPTGSLLVIPVTVTVTAEEVESRLFLPLIAR